MNEEGCQPRQYVGFKHSRMDRDTRCHTWVAVGVGGAALVGSVASGYMSSQAQKSAADKAAKSQRDANQANLTMFRESRGEGGSAVLPTYLQQGGSLFEGQLGEDLVNAYTRSNVDLGAFKTAIEPLRTTQDKAEQFTNDIFNGGITNKLMSEAAPVQTARLTGARQTSIDALNKTLDAIDAAQAGKGFAGDSFGNRAMRFGAMKTRGDSVSAANLQNLGETQQIENYGNVSLPMNNLNLPVSMAQQRGQFEFMPQSNWLQSLQSRMSPMSFIRVGTSAPFQFQPLPTAPPIPGIGQLAAQGIGQMGGTALNYYMQRQQQQNLMDSMPTAGNNAAALAEFNGTGAAGMTGSGISAADIPM